MAGVVFASAVAETIPTEVKIEAVQAFVPDAANVPVAGVTTGFVDNT
jgi:hypothetical protein